MEFGGKLGSESWELKVKFPFSVVLCLVKLMSLICVGKGVYHS